tara:strand:- start:73 stop:816 length:744 start_codon:yes stop_codon:yes gene_type:complete
MATINIGKIKFNWQGTYNAATAYAIDDVVSYNGSSYICIQASTGNLPTVTAYWDQMSQAGTNGTDLTSTLTTQGDILYRDGSGLQRLAAGTSGQALLTGGAGANPSWGEAGGGVLLQYKFSEDNSNRTQSGNFTNNGFSNTLDNTITPTKVGSKILIKTNSIRWYTYGAGTLKLNIDGTTVDSKSHTNSAYPSADQTDIQFNYLYTTTSLNQLSITFTITDSGSGAGSGGFNFSERKGILELFELDI